MFFIIFKPLCFSYLKLVELKLIKLIKNLTVIGP